MGELTNLELPTMGDSPLFGSGLEPSNPGILLSDTRDRLLRIPMGTQGSVLVPLKQIREVFSISLREILPVPETPSCLLGLCNWRGKMLWVIDFPAFINHVSLFHQSFAASGLMILAFELNHQLLGVGVPAVQDIELYDLNRLRPAPPDLVAPHLRSLVLGMLPGSTDLVLNLAAMAQVPLT